MAVRFKVFTNKIPTDILKRPASRAEAWLANEVLKDTRPFVPALNEDFSNAAHVENGNLVVYQGPQAAYLYYGKVMEGPLYGPKHATDKPLDYTKERHPHAQAFWFEASKAQNLDKWERGVGKILKQELEKERK